MITKPHTWWPSGFLVHATFFIGIHINRLEDGKSAQRRIALFVHPEEARPLGERFVMRLAQFGRKIRASSGQGGKFLLQGPVEHRHEW